MKKRKKGKIRKIYLNNQEYKWNVIVLNNKIKQIHIWNESKEINKYIKIDYNIQVTPSMILKYLQKIINKKAYDKQKNN